MFQGRQNKLGYFSCVHHATRSKACSSFMTSLQKHERQSLRGKYHERQLIFRVSEAGLAKLVSCTLTYFWSKLFLLRYSRELLVWHRQSIYLLPRECADLHQVCSRHYTPSLEPSSSQPTWLPHSHYSSKSPLGVWPSSELSTCMVESNMYHTSVCFFCLNHSSTFPHSWNLCTQK